MLFLTDSCAGLFLINATTGLITTYAEIDRDSDPIAKEDGVCVLVVLVGWCSFSGSLCFGTVNIKLNLRCILRVLSKWLFGGMCYLRMAFLAWVSTPSMSMLTIRETNHQHYLNWYVLVGSGSWFDLDILSRSYSITKAM